MESPLSVQGTREIMNHAKNPSEQKLRHNFPIHPQKYAKGAQVPLCAILKHCMVAFLEAG